MNRNIPILKFILIILFSFIYNLNNVFSYDYEVNAANNLTCAGSRTNQDLNCNAGEFTTIVDILTTGESTTCVEGQSLSIDIILTLKDNNAERYDIGFFVGENNNDPRLQTGQCSVATFDSNQSISDSWIDKDHDSCSDFKKNGNSTVKVNNVIVSCIDNDRDGSLDVPYTVVYQQNKNNSLNCSGPLNVSSGSKSKCNFGYAAINDIIVLPKPIADYHFDECSWDSDPNTKEVKDNSSNSYHGNSVNGPVTVDNKTASGGIGRVGYFDGVDDYIEIPQTAADILKGTASLSFWIKTTQTGNDITWAAPSIIGVEEDGGIDDIRWGWIDSNGHIGISKGNNGSNSKSTKIINDGQWHHIVLTWNSNDGNVKIYIDGNLDTQGQTDSGIVSRSFNSIGRTENTNTSKSAVYFNGYLDELKIFDGILSYSQVQQIYNNEKAGKNWDGTNREPPCCCVPENGNLIANPSFEILCNSNIIETWNNVSGGIVHQRKNVCGWNTADVIETWENTTQKPASDGIVFAELDGDRGSTDKIWQILKTEQGKQYTIEFDYKKRDNGHKDNITVYWNGKQVLHIPDNNFSTNEWKTAKITVTGTGNDNFTISETKDADDSYGSWIDNIRVVESTGYKYLLIDASPTALTCQPAEVTITACVNDNCSQKYSDGVSDIELLVNGASWESNPVVINSGSSSATAKLIKHDNGTTILSINNANPLPSDTPIYKCSWDPNCKINFYDSGFIFDIKDTYSYKPQDVTIKAVRKDDQTQACVPAFQNTSLDINFTFDNLSANPTNTAPEINNFTLPNNISLNFDNNGSATFNVVYKEAGKLSFTATYDNGTVFAVGSDTAVFKPFGFYVYTTDNNWQADNGANSTVFKKAGENFNLTVKAVGWQSDTDTDLSDNPVTVNYNEKNISVTHTLVEPFGGDNGSIGVKSLDFTNGVASIDNQTFSEVGIIKFTVTDDDYLGAGSITGASANIGRFIPDHFIIKSKTNGVLNDNRNFIYTGQTVTYLTKPKFIIEAQNKDNQTTKNYSGDFFKLDIGGISIIDPTNDDKTTGNDGNLLSVEINRAIATFTINNDGSATYTFGDDNITYIRDNNSKIAPFIPQLTFKINSIIDNDSVSGIKLPDNISVTGSEMRYGRLKIYDNYGPETEDLELDIETQYWDGKYWVLNTDDSHYSLNINDFKLDNYTEELNNGDTNIDNLTGINGGKGSLHLTTPGENNYGTVDICIDTSSIIYNYLSDSDTCGTATFGIYRGRDIIIDWQEIPPQ